MNELRTKLKNHKGQMLSRFELILIIGIVIALAFWFFIGSDWLQDHQARGEDNLRENTAESVARVNSNNGINCPVDGRSDHCPHWTSEGYYGYYDDVGNTIVGNKTTGYNSYDVMDVNGKKYYGTPGTMIIKVLCSEGKITLSWEIGRK